MIFFSCNCCSIRLPCSIMLLHWEGFYLDLYRVCLYDFLEMILFDLAGFVWRMSVGFCWGFWRIMFRFWAFKWWLWYSLMLVVLLWLIFLSCRKLKWPCVEIFVLSIQPCVIFFWFLSCLEVFIVSYLLVGFIIDWIFSLCMLSAFLFLCEFT